MKFSDEKPPENSVLSIYIFLQLSEIKKIKFRQVFPCSRVRVINRN